MSKEAIDRWKAHQARDRARSRAYRERALEIGRPLPSAIDRAVTAAVAKVWQARIAAVVGEDERDPKRRSQASAEPISAYMIAEAAVDILMVMQARKGTPIDRAVIGRAVMARLRPPLPRPRKKPVSEAQM